MKSNPNEWPFLSPGFRETPAQRAHEANVCYELGDDIAAFFAIKCAGFQWNGKDAAFDVGELRLALSEISEAILSDRELSESVVERVKRGNVEALAKASAAASGRRSAVAFVWLALGRTGFREFLAAVCERTRLIRDPEGIHRKKVLLAQAGGDERRVEEIVNPRVSPEPNARRIVHGVDLTARAARKARKLENRKARDRRTELREMWGRMKANPDRVGRSDFAASQFGFPEPADEPLRTEEKAICIRKKAGAASRSAGKARMAGTGKPAPVPV